MIGIFFVQSYVNYRLLQIIALRINSSFLKSDAAHLGGIVVVKEWRQDKQFSKKKEILNSAFRVKKPKKLGDPFR